MDIDDEQLRAACRQHLSSLQTSTWPAVVYSLKGDTATDREAEAAAMWLSKQIKGVLKCLT